MEVVKLLGHIRELSPDQRFPGESSDLRDVREGSFLETGDDTFRVLRLFVYLDVKWRGFALRKSNYWVTELELLSLTTGEKHYIEFEFDDELEVFETVSRVSLNEVLYRGDKVTHQDLEFIADEESGELVVNGKRFHYSEDDTWAARFFNDKPESVKESDGYPVRFYEFQADDGTALTVEAWQEEPDEKPEREAFLSKKVPVGHYRLRQV